LLQAAAREETDPLVVRRPEWRARAFGSRQLLFLAGRERPEPQVSRAVGSGRDEREVAAIGRQRKRDVKRRWEGRASGRVERERDGVGGERQISRWSGEGARPHRESGDR